MSKKTAYFDPFMCGQCKRGFTSEQAVRSHIKDAHADHRSVAIFKRHGTQSGPEYEPSFGERAVEAELALAMGMPTDDDWLLP